MITKDLIAENTSLEEFFSIINDLLKSSKVQEMKIYNQHAGTSCYKHCMQVAYYTYIVCKRLNLDYISATRGAMLHDLFLYDWHTHIREDKSWKGQHAFMHPKIALRNATQIFNLNDIEKDVIVNHMWPVTIKIPHYKYSAIFETSRHLSQIFHSKTFYKYAYVFLSLVVFRII